MLCCWRVVSWGYESGVVPPALQHFKGAICIGMSIGPHIHTALLRLINSSANVRKVPGAGLEPARVSPPDPKSGASTNFATLAAHGRLLPNQSRFHLEPLWQGEILGDVSKQPTAGRGQQVTSRSD